MSKTIHYDIYYHIVLDLEFENSTFKNGIEKVPCSYYVYPPFDLQHMLPNKIIDPLQQGCFYINKTHHYTTRELISKITSHNDLFSSFLTAC